LLQEPRLGEGTFILSVTSLFSLFDLFHATAGAEGLSSPR
jgi:hypothetical protein